MPSGKEETMQEDPRDESAQPSEAVPEPPVSIAILLIIVLLVRVNAEESLNKIGLDAKATVPALIEALKDKDKDVRRDAAKALGIIGPTAKAAVPALIEMLKDKDVYVRRSAEGALDKIKDGKPSGR